MIKQSLLFLFSICLFVSCKGTDDTGNSNTVDTAAIKEKSSQPKYHPAEEKIAFFLSEIDRFRAGNEYDSLAAANRSLMEYLKTACADEALLQYPFDSLNKYRMRVLTSEDKKFRIYCWDTKTGGTWHFYNAIVQYKTQGGSAGYVLNDISVEEPPASGVWYTEVHTVHAVNCQAYYLPIYYGRFSSIEHLNGISAFAIENNKLDDTPLIFKPIGTPLSYIHYDFTSATDSKRSTDNRISLSPDKKTLSIPVTDEDRIVTDRSLIYKFDGNQFVYDKNAR